MQVGVLDPGEHERAHTMTTKTGTATAPQRSFLKTLLDEREYPTEYKERLYGEAKTRGLSKQRASEAIGYLKRCPVKPEAQNAGPAATAPQLSLIDRLTGEKIVDESYLSAVALLRERGELTMRAASAVIDHLIGCNLRTEVLPFDEGLYAIGTLNDPARYRIKLWRGRVEVTLIGANDHKELVTYREERDAIVGAIAVDPQAARELYAAVTGRCYACDRLLTDDVSVALGIGPVCRGKRS